MSADIFRAEEVKLNVERLISLEAAVELIPMSSRAALYQFLFRNKALFPSRYKTMGLGPKRGGRTWDVRMLTESEILLIREMTLHEGRYRQRRGTVINEETTFGSLFGNVSG